MSYKMSRLTASAIIYVLLSGTGYAQSPVATYQNYVNTNVVQNSQGRITGPVMNSALNYIVPIFNSMGAWDTNGNFTLVGTALPAPTVSTLGGVKAISAPTHQWAYGVNVAGSLIFSQPSFSDLNGIPTISVVPHQYLTGFSGSAFSQAQPAAADISGLAASATVDTTNATNITGGTLPCAQLPSLLGDISSSGCGATLASVNANVGSFGGASAVPAFTVNAKGLITAASSTAVIAPAGTLTGATLASNVTGSSLTSFAAGAAATNLAASAGSTRGGLYEYGASGIGQINPGTSGYVLTSQGAGADPSWQPAVTSSVVGFRNRLVNGGMELATVHQQSSYTISTGSNVYVLDDWYANASGASPTVQQVVSINTSGTVSRATMQFTGAAGVTGITFCQRIEQANSYDMAGQNATLSVDLADSLLTSVNYSISYANATNNFGGGVTSIGSGTFTVSGTSSRYSATVAIPTAATTGIQVCLSVGAQTSGTWNVGAVQFELGSSSTAYERVPVSVQTLRAARYITCTYPSGVSVGTASQDASSLEYNVPSTFANSYGGVNWAFPTQMFTIPTITTYDPHTGASGSAYAQNAAASLAAAGVNISTSFAYLGLTNQSTTQGDFIKFHACAEAEIP